MKSFRHWTPRYIVNRIKDKWYYTRYPGKPWLTPAANQILTSWLSKSDIGLEFGSGRSTLWFARRVKYLTSVEINASWYERIKKQLAKGMIDNVDYHFVPLDAEESRIKASTYISIIRNFDENSLDFVLVDGLYRDLCAIEALRLVRPGGLIIIDNVNWFLPSKSFSPNSRTFQEGPKGKHWRRFQSATYSWRKIWTTSGVTDTAIFIKPCICGQDVLGN